MSAQVHDALVRTLNILEREGWQRDHYHEYEDAGTPTGPRCLVGGVGYAVGIDPVLIGRSEVGSAALWAIARAAGIHVSHIEGAIPAFNDTSNWPTIRATLVKAVAATAPAPAIRASCRIVLAPPAGIRSNRSPSSSPSPRHPRPRSIGGRTPRRPGSPRRRRSSVPGLRSGASSTSRHGGRKER